MQLHKGNSADPTKCNVFLAFLDEDASAIEYEALSYTWGSIDKTHTIMIDNYELPITENLFIALQHLRSAHQDRILWVDAICIDQENLEERGHQVGQMARIYRTAKRVLIWLGPAEDKTTPAVKAMQHLQSRIGWCINDWRPLSEFCIGEDSETSVIDEY